MLPKKGNILFNNFFTAPLLKLLSAPNKTKRNSLFVCFWLRLHTLANLLASRVEMFALTRETCTELRLAASWPCPEAQISCCPRSCTSHNHRRRISCSSDHSRCIRTHGKVGRPDWSPPGFASHRVQVPKPRTVWALAPNQNQVGRSTRSGQILCKESEEKSVVQY